MENRSSSITRRKFLRRSAALSAMLAAPHVIPSSAIGLDDNAPPSERIAIGAIGQGVMGSVHLSNLASDPGLQVLAVCDVDRGRRENARQTVEKHYADAQTRGAYHGCAAYNDYREVLARGDIDAVLIATPDHWHALQAVDAAKAGKDIYCEKPISLTIYEGRRVVEAVRRYGRVFQTGTQYRSNPMIREVCQFVRDGRLGKVKSAFALFQNVGIWMGGAAFEPYSQIIDIGTCGKLYHPMEFPFPAEAVPEGLDWNQWVGPALWHPYNHVYHRNPLPGVVPWAFCESFGAASLTGFLAHAADVIQYALGVEESGPMELIHPRTGEFPTLTCRYANGTLLHFVDRWEMVKDAYHAVPATARLAGNFGGVFVGERGWITSMTGGGNIEGGPEDVVKELGLTNPDVKAGRNNHLADWLECIQTRKRPSSSEELGHRCASLGHLAHISCQLGRSLRWDPVAEEFLGDEYVNRLRGRVMRAPWQI